MHIVLETPGGTGLYLSFNVFGWLCVTVLISLGLWQITLNDKITYSKIHIYSFIGFICLCIPMFYGSEFSDHAIPRLLGLGGGLLLLFVLYQFEELKQEPQQVLWWILIAVAVQACFGLVQYFILKTGDWGGYKLGISRPHGSFLQPNVMASFMATGIAIALYLSVTVKEFSFNKYQQALCYFCLFSSTFLLVALQSKTGHLSAILSLAFISLYAYFQSKRQLLTNLFFVGIALITAFMSFNNSEVFKRSEDNYQQVNARTDIYLVTSKMIIDKPIFGYGYGNFERSYLDFNNTLKLENPNINPPITKLAHPHNEALYWISEGGIIALLSVIVFFMAYMTSWLKISNKRAKRLALLGLLIPLLLHSQFEFPFYSSVSHWFVFIILLWFTDVQSNNKKSIYIWKKRFLLRFLAILTFVVFVPFLVTSLQTGIIIVNHEKNGYQDLEKLTEIINPIAWQSRLDANIYAHTLIAGLREKNPAALQRYISWGLERIRYAPRKRVYSNILLCLRILKQDTEYRRVLKEAKLTYPLVENWGINTLMTEKH